jgi:predicted DNA-binding transcriptional regulator AlpA
MTDDANGTNEGAKRPHGAEADGRPAPFAAALTPLLVDLAALAVLLARSPASLHRDDAAGRLPTSLRIGGSKRWRYSEIVAWVEAGMPDRRTWNTMRDHR